MKEEPQFKLKVVITPTREDLYIAKRNSIVGFTWLWERLRGFIGREDDAEAVKEYIISIYREYNAPLPEELVVHISDEL